MTTRPCRVLRLEAPQEYVNILTISPVFEWYCLRVANRAASVIPTSQMGANNSLTVIIVSSASQTLNYQVHFNHPLVHHVDLALNCLRWKWGAKESMCWELLKASSCSGTLDQIHTKIAMFGWERDDAHLNQTRVQVLSSQISGCAKVVRLKPTRIWIELTNGVPF